MSSSRPRLCHLSRGLLKMWSWAHCWPPNFLVPVCDKIGTQSKRKHLYAFLALQRCRHVSLYFTKASLLNELEKNKTNKTWSFTTENQSENLV